MIRRGTVAAEAMAIVKQVSARSSAAGGGTATAAGDGAAAAAAGGRTDPPGAAAPAAASAEKRTATAGATTPADGSSSEASSTSRTKDPPPPPPPAAKKDDTKWPTELRSDPDVTTPLSPYGHFIRCSLCDQDVKLRHPYKLSAWKEHKECQRHRALKMGVDVKSLRKKRKDAGGKRQGSETKKGAGERKAGGSKEGGDESPKPRRKNKKKQKKGSSRISDGGGDDGKAEEGGGGAGDGAKAKTTRSGRPVKSYNEDDDDIDEMIDEAGEYSEEDEYSEEEEEEEDPLLLLKAAPKKKKRKTTARKTGAGSDETADADAEEEGADAETTTTTKGDYGMDTATRSKFHADILKYFQTLSARTLREGTEAARQGKLVGTDKEKKIGDVVKALGEAFPEVEVAVSAAATTTTGGGAGGGGPPDQGTDGGITELERRYTAAADKDTTTKSGGRKRKLDPEHKAAMSELRKKARKEKASFERKIKSLERRVEKFEGEKRALRLEQRAEYEQQKALKQAEKQVEEERKAQWHANRTKSWDDRYEELRRFREAFGHTNVPKSYENKSLVNWVGNQREKLYRLVRDGKKTKTPEMEERIAKLDELGFEWRSSKAHVTTPWEDRFDQLLEFRAVHGHCRVPKKYPPNQGLAEFVKTQRRQYREKCPVIRGERTDRLLEVGFEFVVCPTHRSWDERYVQLVEFKRRNGHCRVPSVDARTSSAGGAGGDSDDDDDDISAVGDNPDDERAFRRWAHRQRSEHAKFVAGQRCWLDHGRIRKLEALGYDFGVGR